MRGALEVLYVRQFHNMHFKISLLRKHLILRSIIDLIKSSFILVSCCTLRLTYFFVRLSFNNNMPQPISKAAKQLVNHVHDRNKKQSQQYLLATAAQCKQL